MIREYLINEVWFEDELCGRYENTVQGIKDAEAHVARLKEIYGDDGIRIVRNTCNLYELSNALELDYDEIPKHRYMR